MNSNGSGELTDLESIGSSETTPKNLIGAEVELPQHRLVRETDLVLKSRRGRAQVRRANAVLLSQLFEFLKHQQLRLELR